MDNENQRILLTGAGGCLGTAIRAHAGPERKIIPLDSASRGDPTIHVGSFTDEALLDETLPGCDTVIHTAALHGGNRETHSPPQFTDINITGLVTLVEACLRHRVRRVVFSSSMEVLIGGDWLASGLSVVDEETPPNPNWIYSLNKLLGEQIGRYYHAHHRLEFVALRYMWFHAGQTPDASLLARKIMPEDVARANLLAATRPGLGFQIFNIGPKTPLTNADIAEAASAQDAVIERYWPGASVVLKAQGVTLDQTYFWPVTRIDKAKLLLDWEPQATFETYLQSLGWRRENSVAEGV